MLIRCFTADDDDTNRVISYCPKMKDCTGGTDANCQDWAEKYFCYTVATANFGWSMPNDARGECGKVSKFRCLPNSWTESICCYQE